MGLNLGYMEATCRNGDVIVRIYYDNTVPASPDQPLINGPRGFCLDVTNISGSRATVTVSGISGNPLTVRVAQGNPVTTGQSRSRTAAQVAALGWTTRGSVGDFGLSDQ